MKQPCTDRSSEPASPISHNSEDWALWLEAEYKAKWRSDDLERTEAAKAFLEANDGIAFGITLQEVFHAFSRLKRAHRCDHYGVSLSCLWNVFCAREEASTLCLNNQISSFEAASFWCVKGRFLSKVAGSCLPRQTRSILPMPCTLMLVDTVVATRCTDHLSAVPPPDLCFIEAARKHRSTTDVVFAARQVIEKGFDNYGKTAIAAGDIERLYEALTDCTKPRQTIQRIKKT